MVSLQQPEAEQENQAVADAADAANTLAQHSHDITIGGDYVSKHVLAFDHIVFYVSCPKIVAAHLIDAYGFELYATRGLETGERNISAVAVKNGSVVFVFMAALRPLHSCPDDPLVDEIHRHVALHGDAVKDVAFLVDDVEGAVDFARKGGAEILVEPHDLEDTHGTLTVAKIKGLNDVVHSFVFRGKYEGFLDKFQLAQPSNTKGDAIRLASIDHCVQNEDWNQMKRACQYYKKVFGFHVFWSVDAKDVSTVYSALKSTVMASYAENVKMPINEPAVGLKKSQIEEFIEFNHGSGIQHIAIMTTDIIDTIKKMKRNGVDFINVPETYYTNMEKRLKLNKHPKIKESMKTLKKHGILIDFDEKGYLLQLFTRPFFERPTFFFEIIQRHNHNGFGAGNFKGLFEVLEHDQRKRGNLTDQTAEDRNKGLAHANKQEEFELVGEKEDKLDDGLLNSDPLVADCIFQID